MGSVDKCSANAIRNSDKFKSCYRCLEYTYIEFYLIFSSIFFENIETSVWLRRVCYDRIQKGRTLGVFVLSAFWVRNDEYKIT